MKEMVRKMMLSCDAASLLVEKRADIGLTGVEKMKLAFHTSMCGACRNYVKQSAVLEKLLRTYMHNNERTQLSAQVSAQIKRQIADVLSGI